MLYAKRKGQILANYCTVIKPLQDAIATLYYLINHSLIQNNMLKDVPITHLQASAT